MFTGHAFLPVTQAVSWDTPHQAIILTLIDCVGAADPSHFQDAEQQFLQLLRTPDLDKQFRCFAGMRRSIGRARPVCGRPSCHSLLRLEIADRILLQGGSCAAAGCHSA
jgi:hypothetical protein